MPKRLTQEEYIEKLAKENPTVELLSEYNGNKNYITVRCKIDGNIWQTKPNWLHAGQGCQVCYDRRRGESSKIPLDVMIKRAQDKFKDENGEPLYDYSLIKEEDYKNSHQKVPIICKKHGVFYHSFTRHIFGGRGCQICAMENLNIDRRMGKEEFIRKAQEIQQDENGEPLYIYDKVEYINCDTPVCIICKEHGEFWQTPYLHLKGFGCKKCNISLLEKEMVSFLNDNKVEYIWQATNKDLEWLNRQTLDFYLPKYNMAIECQGGQHFKTVEHFGGEEEFEKIIERDKRKFDLCKEHNINLIYIIPENINKEKILLNENLNDIYNKENLIYISDKINFFKLS